MVVQSKEKESWAFSVGVDNFSGVQDVSRGGLARSQLRVQIWRDEHDIGSAFSPRRGLLLVRPTVDTRAFEPLWWAMSTTFDLHPTSEQTKFQRSDCLAFAHTTRRVRSQSIEEPRYGNIGLRSDCDGVTERQPGGFI